MSPCDRFISFLRFKVVKIKSEINSIITKLKNIFLSTWIGLNAEHRPKTKDELTIFEPRTFPKIISF